MASKQFDLSAEQLKLIQEKAKRRAVLREEFLKQSSNPFKHGSMEGGTVFDAAIQRFGAMRVSSFEHWKPNARTSMIGFLTIIVPMFSYGYLVKSKRDCNEHKLRSGEVAYKDRLFKLI